MVMRGGVYFLSPVPTNCTIWRIPMASPALLTPERLAWLSDAERERAARFRFPEHALRWRVAHVALRDLLAQALGCLPAAVVFTTDGAGKPQLAHEPGLQFNLSHSGDVALIAIGETTPLGVDVELIKPVPEMRGVAASHFADEEREALWAEADEAQRLDAFYRCWTRKEAYVKATGIGVGPALATFAVTLAPGESRLLRADGEADAARQWSITDLDLGLPYIGALAIRDPAVRITRRDWEPR
jgi:4'-phosphopantetheinyl transferase